MHKRPDFYAGEKKPPVNWR
ncbi:hypothetical protein [Escherichia albertii]